MKRYYQGPDNAEISNAIDRLQFLVNTIPPLIRQMPDSDFTSKPTETAWSKKEILGHLIDSATNNHQRFIRIQYENNPVIGYGQDEWNALSGYNYLDSNHVVNFWTIYNQHLIYILNQIPEEMLTKTGLLLDGTEMPLAWYINDYVAHMEHHLKDIVKY